MSEAAASLPLLDAAILVSCLLEPVVGALALLLPSLTQGRPERHKLNFLNFISAIPYTY